jgi:hypothetical protein
MGVSSARAGAGPRNRGREKQGALSSWSKRSISLVGGYSTDGTTFTAIDPPNGTIPNLSPFTCAGLCVTARQEGTLASAKFNASSIKIQ